MSEGPFKHALQQMPPCSICGGPSVGIHIETVLGIRTDYKGAAFVNEEVVRYFCGLHEKEALQELLLECKKRGDWPPSLS
jgi:hypothetical protein